MSTLKMLITDKYIEFNDIDKCWHVTSNKLDSDIIRSIYSLVKILRENPPEPNSYKTTHISKIQTGFRDNCLQKYCIEVFDEKKSDSDTCWTRHGLHTRCLGMLDENKYSSIEEYIEKIINEEWKNAIDPFSISFKKSYLNNKTQILNNIELSKEKFVIYYSKGLKIKSQNKIDNVKLMLRRLFSYPEGKNIVKIVNSIKSKGWDANLSIHPLGGVLGFSDQLGIYNVFTGKHRIAALKYLYHRGEIDDIEINYPIIKYPWGRWMHWIPHSRYEICRECKF